MNLNQFRLDFPELASIDVSNSYICRLVDYFDCKYSCIKTQAPKTYAIVIGLWVAHHVQLSNNEGGGARTGLKQSWKEGDVSVQYWNGGSELNRFDMTIYGTQLMEMLKPFKALGFAASAGCSSLPYGYGYPGRVPRLH